MAADIPSYMVKAWYNKCEYSNEVLLSMINEEENSTAIKTVSKYTFIMNYHT